MGLLSEVAAAASEGWIVRTPGKVRNIAAEGEPPQLEEIGAIEWRCRLVDQRDLAAVGAAPLLVAVGTSDARKAATLANARATLEQSADLMDAYCCAGVVALRPAGAKEWHSEERLVLRADHAGPGKVWVGTLPPLFRQALGTSIMERSMGGPEVAAAVDAFRQLHVAAGDVGRGGSSVRADAEPVAGAGPGPAGAEGGPAGP